MRLPTLLLFFGLTAGLFAQSEPDNLDPRYRDIFNRTKAKLQELGYDVGRAGNAAYVPDQYLILRFGANAAAQSVADLQSLKEAFGDQRVNEVGQCGCAGRFQLNLMQIDSLGGEERGKDGSDRVVSTVGVEETAPNYYLMPSLNEVANNPVYNNLPAGFAVLSSGKPATPVDIAVLDTGIDLQYQDPTTAAGHAPLYLWENPEELAGGGNDPFCYEEDIVGWDFVNEDNAPLDDHSHGTHVASRIAEQLANNAPDVNYRFMSLKMLDENGVGTSFTATCAVLYAAYHNADVINASWGFYGESDPVLRRAFAHAQQRGVVAVASAGNERVDLADYLHYPSSYALDQRPMKGLLFISAADQSTRLWPATNYRTEGLAAGGFVAAPGVNQFGLVPSHLPGPIWQTKTGTSVATPYASALAAYARHLRPNSSPVSVRDRLLVAIQQYGTANKLSFSGTSYPYFTFDWVELR